MTNPQEQRRFAQTGTSAPLGGSGYGALVLERLAKQVCRIAGVEWSCIFVRDRNDPRSVIAAAGHGLPWDLIGARLGADEGSLARVLGPAVGGALFQQISPGAPYLVAAGLSLAAVLCTRLET